MLNPIENSFSKIKLLVREKLRRNVGKTLSKIIYSLLDQVTENDCSGYFRYMIEAQLIMLLKDHIFINKFY